MHRASLSSVLSAVTRWLPGKRRLPTLRGVSGARRGGTANTSTIGGKHTEKPRVGEFPGGAGRLPEAPHLWRAGPG